MVIIGETFFLAIELGSFGVMQDPCRKQFHLSKILMVLYSVANLKLYKIAFLINIFIRQLCHHRNKWLHLWRSYIVIAKISTE